MKIPKETILLTVGNALREDVGYGDITTGCFDTGRAARAVIRSKASGILAGLDVAETAFLECDSTCRIERVVEDGASVAPGDTLATVHGPAGALLTAERTALNFLQRMSGIATLTRIYVDAVSGTRAAIVDTRKTTPGLRTLEKYAVRVGGGRNHRFGLFDAVLIKDNHIALAGGVRAAIETVRGQVGHMVKIEVEVRTTAELGEALETGVDVIMLDNMDPPAVREAVSLVAGRAVVEVSGNVTTEQAKAAAAAGVDVISVGALTHSAPSLDISMYLVTA